MTYKIKFRPGREHLVDPIVEIRSVTRTEREYTPYYKEIPLIHWLEENVGEMASVETGSWAVGNGWQMCYDYSGPPDKFYKNHCIIIQRDIEDKLITELVLRFS